MKRLLRADQTLFRDPDVFDFASMPDHLHHRDAQVKELAFLLRGPPGPGRPPPSAGSFPRSGRRPGRSSRSTSTAGPSPAIEEASGKG